MIICVVSVASTVSDPEREFLVVGEVCTCESDPERAEQGAARRSCRIVVSSRTDTGERGAFKGGNSIPL